MGSDNTVLGIPISRIVAFAGPHISVAAGAVASWLLVHVHVLGLFHFQHDGLAAGIAQGVVLVLVSTLTWAGHHTWLKGHHLALGLAAGASVLPAQMMMGNVDLPENPMNSTSGVRTSDPDDLEPLEPGDHFDGLPHHHITDPKEVSMDEGDVGHAHPQEDQS